MCLIAAMTDTALAEENALLKARLAETEAALADAVEAQKRLESIVSELRREKFGRKSEKLDPEQFNLPLEDVELAQGVLDAGAELGEDLVGYVGGGLGDEEDAHALGADQPDGLGDLVEEGVRGVVEEQVRLVEEEDQ